MVRTDATVAPKSKEPQAGGPRGDLLEDRIRDGLAGCLAEQTAIALQIARALQQLHNQGKYHGRIRSGGIFLDEDNRAVFDGEPGSDQSLMKADIHGFGTVLYELFSGRILEHHDQEVSPDIEPLHKTGITPRLIEIVRRCLSPEDRPSDLVQCTTDLEILLRQMIGEPAPSDNRGKKIGIAVVALSAVAGIAWVLVR